MIKFLNGYAIVELSIYGGTRVLRVYTDEIAADEFIGGLISEPGIEYHKLNTVVEDQTNVE